MRADSPLVIGIGNDFAGDDGAGLAVARALAGRLRTATSPGLAADLVNRMAGEAHVILVDAARSGAPVGTLCHFNAHEAPLPGHFNRLSSHGMGVGEAIELARILGSLPATCEVWGIEGSAFGQGAHMTASVARAVETLAARLLHLAENTLFSVR